MEIIELLNRLYNDDYPPKRIKYKNECYILYNNKYCRERDKHPLSFEYVIEGILNDSVEVLSDYEEIEKIDRLNWRSCCEDWYTANKNIDLLLEQINKISDKLNEVIDIINKEVK